MNIEESKSLLGWVSLNKLYIDTHNECDYHNIHTAIETLLTAYEKEKEKNKELNKLKGFEMLDIFNMGKQSSRQRIEFDYVSKEKLKELKEFYIKDCKDKNMTLITLENLVKNINILLDIGGIKQ